MLFLTHKFLLAQFLVVCLHGVFEVNPPCSPEKFKHPSLVKPCVRFQISLSDFGLLRRTKTGCYTTVRVIWALYAWLYLTKSSLFFCRAQLCQLHTVWLVSVMFVVCFHTELR